MADDLQISTAWFEIAQAVGRVHGAPMQGPLALSLVFVLPRPQKLIWKTREMPRAWHTGKPDSDNLQKSLKDALTKLMWVDDAQVCRVDAVKYIAAGDEQPHVEVVIEQLAETTP